MSDTGEHMNADEHIAEARRLLDDSYDEARHYLARAQVHALLAIADELGRMNRIKLGGKP